MTGLFFVELRSDGGVGIEGGRVEHRTAGSRWGSLRLRLTSEGSWLLKLLGNELLLLWLLRLLLGNELLLLRLLRLLLRRPSPGCEDKLELIRSDGDFPRSTLALLALRSKLSLLLLLGQQLLLLLLLLLDRPVDVELGEARLPCFGDLVLNEADLLLTLVQELLLFRTEFQWLQALNIKVR